jgi:aminoglycoside phosphotransferase (APT) family kinase protein
VTKAAEPDVALAQRILVATGLDFTRVAHFRSGREHHLFRVYFRGGQERILKVPRNDGIGDPWWPGRTQREALRAEREAIQRVRRIDVPTPYHVLPTDPPASIMGVVEGMTPEMVHDRGLLDTTLLSAVCHEMGALLARIHDVKQPEGTSCIPVLDGADPSRAHLLHMDFHLGNVLGSLRVGGRWYPTGVIDWTWAKWGPREADFAEMGVSVLLQNPWALEPMLQGYREECGLQLEPAVVFTWIRRELERRLRDEPPADETMRALWQQKITLWSEGRFL